MPLKTLLLNPPSFENFDGGAGSRWPATREIESYSYPVWLAYPAGMLEGSRKTGSFAMELLRSDYRQSDPRSMVPVRLAGAEVTEAFWAKLAVLS
jgi:hypothetical protein